MIEIIKYPDQSSYVKEEKFLPNITFRINNYEDLWHLNQYVDVCNHNGYTPTITIPCLLDAQADRRFNSNESSGLKLVCKFLNSMKANFKIFHPHNFEVVSALIDKVEIIDNSEFILEVFTKLNSEEQFKKGGLDKNLVILLPDGGAYKWGVKLMDKLGFQGDVLAAAKNRKFVDGKSVLTQQLPDYDFKGKDVLLIDDLLIYGNSAIGLAKMLKEKNANKIYGAFSHLTIQNFPDNSLFNIFNHIYTTNSKYENYFIPQSPTGGVQPNNLTIFKLF